jgi:hypothetical protein
MGIAFGMMCLLGIVVFCYPSSSYVVLLPGKYFDLVSVRIGDDEEVRRDRVAALQHLQLARLRALRLEPFAEYIDSANGERDAALVVRIQGERARSATRIIGRRKFAIRGLQRWC